MNEEEKIAELLEQTEENTWRDLGRIFRKYCRKNDKGLVVVINFTEDGIFDRSATIFENKENIETVNSFVDSLMGEFRERRKQQD